MAEPNQSNPPPSTPPIHTAEPVVIQKNPSSEHPPPIPPPLTPTIHSGTVEPNLINPSTPPPQNYPTFSVNHQNPNRTMSDRSISSLENQDLNHPFQQQFNQSHYININEPPFSAAVQYSPPSPSLPLQPAVSTPTSAALPHQYHGFLSTLFEYFLSHIARQSMPAPPLHQLTPSGSFNFRVEPILLHVNSSVPLLNHDQLNSSLSKTISSSSSEVPEPNPQSPQPQQQAPPPKPETNHPPQNAAASQPPPPAQPAEALKNPTGGGVPCQPSPQNLGKHQKALRKAGNLANLLPTGTVLAFQALTPTLSDGGKCQLTNKILVGVVVIVCTIICFCSSFTDSKEYKGKVYYGIATRKGLMVFNYEQPDLEEPIVKENTKHLKVKPSDFVHAFLSMAVFLVFAFSSSQFHDCFFPRKSKETEYSMVVYLPLVTGILASFLFTIFPTQRKGIGYTP